MNLTILDLVEKKFKNDFSTPLSDLSNSLNEKFDSLDKHLGESERKIKVACRVKTNAGLKLIQLEQQKTQLPLIILAKKLKPILCRVIKGT